MALLDKTRPASLRNCPAPAKLNLFLHVIGRRPDGYHLLETVFQLTDFCDYLHFTCRDDGQITLQQERPTAEYPYLLNLRTHLLLLIPFLGALLLMQ